jgi:hypothetical protein
MSFLQTPVGKVIVVVVAIVALVVAFVVVKSNWPSGTDSRSDVSGLMPPHDPNGPTVKPQAGDPVGVNPGGGPQGEGGRR